MSSPAVLPILPDAAAAHVQQNGIWPSLNGVPDDVLLLIWTQIGDPASFALVSKRFAAISKDTFFRARWFLQRYPRYEVVFQAIARPKIFTARLLEVLLNSRAPLSRHLVQMLDCVCKGGQEPHIHWGSRLGSAAYAAVNARARDLYGLYPSLDPHQFDQDAFLRSLRFVSEAADLPPQVTELMNVFEYMPLPLCFDQLGSLTETAIGYIESLLLLRPKLATLIVSKGYETELKTSLWACQAVFASTDFGNEISLNCMKLKFLQEAGALLIPRNIASQVIYGLRRRTRGYTTQHLPLARPDSYQLLIALYKANVLKFDLKQVVQEIVAYLIKGIDTTMFPLIEKLVEDFSSPELSSLYVQMVFIQAEVEAWDLGKIVDKIASHPVKSQDIQQVCSHNLTKSSIPLQYGVQFIPGFDVGSIVKATVEMILSQPYRGPMLRNMDELFSSGDVDSLLQSVRVDFRTILASAVERKTFTHQQVPAQEWYQAPPPVQFQEEDDEWEEEEEEVGRLVNVEAPVHSLFCARWTKWQDRQYDYGATPIDYNPHPGFVAVYTEIIAEHPSSSVSSHNITTAQSTTTTAANSDGLGSVELVRLQDAWKPSKQWPIAVQMRADDLYRYQNINGDVGKADDNDAIALAIVDILGPASRSAHVTLMHSLAAGNSELSDGLLKRGVMLTFEHVRVAEKLACWALPRGARDQIATCLNFKASYDAPENKPDPMLSQVVPTLSAEEQEKCNALGESEKWPRTLLLHEEGGALRIESTESTQRSTAAKIFTGPPSLSTDLPASIAAPVSTVTTIEAALLSPRSVGAPGQDERYVVVRGPVPFTISSTERNSRLRSAKLWAQHLGALKHAEEVRRAALDSAFACSETKNHEVRSGLLDLLWAAQSTLDWLSQAIPMSHASELVLELFDLWRDISKMEEAKTVEEIMALAQRRFEGRHLRRNDRRKALNYAHCSFRRDPYGKHNPIYTESENDVCRIRDDDPFDETYSPNAPAAEEGETDEPETESAAEPARKRAKLAQSTDATSSSSSTDESDSDLDRPITFGLTHKRRAAFYLGTLSLNPLFDNGAFTDFLMERYLGYNAKYLEDSPEDAYEAELQAITQQIYDKAQETADAEYEEAQDQYKEEEEVGEHDDDESQEQDEHVYYAGGYQGYAGGYEGEEESDHSDPDGDSEY